MKVKTTLTFDLERLKGDLETGLNERETVLANSKLDFFFKQESGGNVGDGFFLKEKG